MIESAVIAHEMVEFVFAGVAEGGVADVVGEADGFGEVFVDVEGAGEGAADGGHFHGVGESGAVVIVGAVDEYLRFVFEATEASAMEDAVAVAREAGAGAVFVFVVFTAEALIAAYCVRGEDVCFVFFPIFSCFNHPSRVPELGGEAILKLVECTGCGSVQILIWRLKMNEVTLSKETVFRGKIMEVEVHQVAAKGGPAVREIVTHGPAVCLVVKRDNGKFIFIKQFRKALERDVFEVCAGNCDPGEPAIESAKRELTEETGFVADLIRPLGTIYPCVGYCTERISVFYAEVSKQGETNFDHDEDIETLEVTAEEMIEMIRADKIQDGKTLAAWALYEAIINE